MTDVRRPISRAALVLLLLVIGYLVIRDRTENDRLDRHSRANNAATCSFEATIARELDNVDRHTPTGPAGTDIQDSLTRIRDSAQAAALSAYCTDPAR